MRFIKLWFKNRKSFKECKAYCKRRESMDFTPKEYKSWRRQVIGDTLPYPPDGFYEQPNGNGDMGR